MATNKQLKFFKGASAPAAPAAGMIWFCTEDRTIRVYTGAEWEKYAGLVNANWNGTDKLLTITNAAGVETKLDLSDCASASDITTKLTTINNTLTSHDGRITAAQNAADAAAQAASVADGKAVQEKTDREAAIEEVKGLISAEQTRAEGKEAENKAAAEAADKKAADAQAYAEGVNTALGQEVTRATKKEDELAGKISALETAVGADGSVADAIKNAIEALDATVGSQSVADGKHVAVEVVETDGKLTGLTVVESDIASAQALADEISARGVAEQGLSNRIDALAAAETGRVSILEAQVAALNAATHFEGKVEGESFDAAVAASGKTYESGDIVIYGNKEFIYDGEAWIELGDTTAESDRISQLESWKTTAAQNIADNAANIASNDTDILDLQNEVSGIKNTMATDDELESVRSDLQGKLDAANASIGGHKTRIEALEAVAEKLDDNYVNEGDYATDQAAVANRIKGVEDRATALEGFKSTTEAALEAIGTAQGQQDEAIAAAEALGQKGIDDAADALAEAQAKVASVTAGDYISVGNDAKNPVVSVNVTGNIAEGNTGLVTGGAIFNELCWVEFN